MSFSFSATYSALWALVVFQGVVILALLRKLSEVSKLVEKGGLPGENRLAIGARAPSFAGYDQHSGKRVDIRIFSRQGGMILFLAGDCSMCRGLAGSLSPSAAADLGTMIAFCVGRELGCMRFVKRLSPSIPLLLDAADETVSRFRVSAFPTVVLVDKDQRIRGYGHPTNLADLVRLRAGLDGDDLQSANQSNLVLTDLRETR